VSDLVNSNKSYKFQDLKSGNLNFLSADKNVRNIEQLLPSKNLFNFSDRPNNMFSLNSLLIEGCSSSDEFRVFNTASGNWTSPNLLSTLLSSSLSFTPSHTPIYSNASTRTDKSFDQFLPGFEDQSPTMLRSKEETAPSYLFTSYWNTI